MTDSGATAPTSAETLAASVARLAQDLMEFSSERVADVVERAGAAVANLLQATGGALSAGGGGEAREACAEAPSVADVGKNTDRSSGASSRSSTSLASLR